MNKQEFLNELMNRLEGLPEDELQKARGYYSEMIDDRIEDGMSEEEAVADIGSLDSAVEEILMDVPLSKMIRAKAKKQRKRKGWQLALIIIGSPLWAPLMLAFLAVLFALYITIWACVISFFAVDLAFAIAGPACIIVGIAALFRMPPATPLLAISAGLFLTGVALLLFCPLVQLAKATAKLGKHIILWIKSWFVGGKKNA